MPEAASQVIRRWFEEVWNKHRRDAIGEMLSPNAVVHDSGTDAGPTAFYDFYDRMQASFSDIRMTIDEEVSQGDKVCIRWSCTMKHTGSGLGRPTNKQLRTTGISMVRIENGKLREGWQNWDMLGVMQQINGEVRAPTYMADPSAASAGKSSGA